MFMDFMKFSFSLTLEIELPITVEKRLKRIILYDPDIAVYHHRRKGWEGYVRQTFRFGLHRGYFMKIFSYTSLHPIFFPEFQASVDSEGEQTGQYLPIRQNNRIIDQV